MTQQEKSRSSAEATSRNDQASEGQRTLETTLDSLVGALQPAEESLRSRRELRADGQLALETGGANVEHRARGADHVQAAARYVHGVESVGGRRAAARDRLHRDNELVRCDGDENGTRTPTPAGLLRLAEQERDGA